MLRTVASTAAGLAVGIMIALSVPAVAHHGPAFDVLRERVIALEREQDRQADLTRHLRDRVRSLKDRVSIQEGLTQEALLDILALEDTNEQTAEALADQLDMLVDLIATDQLLDARIDALESG